MATKGHAVIIEAITKKTDTSERLRRLDEKMGATT
jgi:hypothetical protein